jgi:endonuclease/exonuclease/phosphatase family metal-dependent hydrolase
MGPQYPAGRRADPIPEHLNEESLDVPTYYSKSSNTPAGAYVQVDHVFASRGFHTEVEATALNEVDEWGPSDHCRLLIEVETE